MLTRVRVATKPSALRKLSRLNRLGTRRLARAHVTLKERPRVALLGQEALQAICEAMGRELEHHCHRNGPVGRMRS